MVRLIFRFLISILGILVVIVGFSNLIVISSTYSRVFDTIEELPDRDVGLVLGTSRRLTTGADNPFFYNRMNTAAELYKQGKVHSLLLSGDSTSRYYNEPSDMKKAMVELGIPDSVIMLDNSGLSTLESMRRCKEVFEINSITVVTQRFHSYRAVYLGDHFDIDSNAIVTDEVPIGRSFRTLIREIFARSKAVGDVYIN
jgi:SanA protein